MKPLPVIQPSQPSTPAAAGSGPVHTAGMIDDPEKSAALMPLVVKALATVFDPEIPVNIYELGLIYGVIIEASGVVGIRMTLTAPACPAAQFLPRQVQERVAAVPGVADVKVDVVWDPPWDRDRMSEAARLQLGMF
jgi:FeS assembly SUF system protein